MVMLSLLDCVHKGMQRTVSREKDRGEDIVTMRKKMRFLQVQKYTYVSPSRFVCATKAEG